MGRTLLALGAVILGSLTAAPAGACGVDDRFPCAQSSQSSDSKSDQSTSASKPQRTTSKVRTQRKHLAAKKIVRNASRAKIIQASAKTKSRRLATARVEQIAPTDTVARIETSLRADVRARAETPALVEESPASQAASTSGKAPIEPLPPLYQVASAEPAPPLTTPAPPTSDLLIPVPTAGAAEMIRFAVPNQAPQAEQLSSSAPIVAAAEAPMVEFKSDPARLFDKRTAAVERATPRKEGSSGLSWMQAVLLALGGGIIAMSGFMLFSVRTRPSEAG